MSASVLRRIITTLILMWCGLLLGLSHQSSLLEVLQDKEERIKKGHAYTVFHSLDSICHILDSSQAYYPKALFLKMLAARESYQPEECRATLLEIDDRYSANIEHIYTCNEIAQLIQSHLVSGKMSIAQRYRDKIRELSMTIDCNSCELAARLNFVDATLVDYKNQSTDSSDIFIRLAYEKITSCSGPFLLHARILKVLARTDADQLNHDQALLRHREEREVLGRIYPSDHFDIASSHYNSGNILYEIGQYQRALDHYVIAHPIWKKRYKPEVVYMRFLTEAIGDMYWELGQKALALRYYDESIAGEKLVNHDESDDVARTGDQAIKVGAYDDALVYYQSALEMRQKNYGLDHPLTSACHSYIGRVYLARNELDKALPIFQHSIDRLTNRDTTVEESLIKTYSVSPGTEIYLLDALRSKALLYERLWQRSNSIADLKTAYETYAEAVDLIDNIRKSPKWKSVQEFWTNEAHPLFQKTGKLAIELYQIEGDEYYYNSAFDISERSKAFLLLTSMNESLGRHSEDIPDLIKEEKKLADEIEEYSAKLRIEQNRCDDSNPKIMDAWNDHLMSLTIIQDEIIDDIARELPDYFHLIYNVSSVNVPDLQKKLDTLSNYLLVEYFDVGDQIFVFGISANRTSLDIIDTYQDLEILTHEFRRSLYKYNAQSNQRSREKYIKVATGLYHMLLSNTLNQHSKTDGLIIIADGNTTQLPFEALLATEDTLSAEDYRSWPYLMREYPISYNQSAAIMVQALRERPKLRYRHELLAVAPEYSMSDDYGPLLHSKNEVLAITALVAEHKSIVGRTTSHQFVECAPHSSIIHLAMHSKIDFDDPANSQLYFDDPSEAEGAYPMYRLHNLDLKAQLTVLSSCNTAVGSFNRGEGVMSIARNFQKAGCPSLVASLWAVDDEATLQLMSGFYSHLFSGKPKDVALRQAKLDYLDHADLVHANPYFWSGFVLIGNTAPIDLGDGGVQAKAWTIGLLLLIVIVLVFLSRRDTFSSFK